MMAIVTDVLDDSGIEYQKKEHEKDAHSCKDAARERDVALSQILKCMVGRDTAGCIYVMLIPGNKTLKIRKVRHIVGGIRIDLIPPEELTKKYGLTVGAISPIHFIGKARFYLDKTVLEENEIDISSGSLNAGIEIKTSDLIDLLNPTICDIVSNKS